MRLWKTSLTILLSLFFDLKSFADGIPTLHENLIKKTFSKLFKNNLLDSIEVIEGGYSSPGIYKIQNGQKNYVLRLSNPRQPLQNRQNEIEAIKIASNLGIAPFYHHGSLKGGYILMDFVPGEKITSEHFKNNVSLLKKIAKTLRKLHDGPELPKPFKNVFQRIRFFESFLQGKRPTLLIQALNQLSTLENTLTPLLEYRPCHNDLNPNNILYDQEAFTFVDWEYASQEDPYFDLATLSTFFALSSDQENTLLENYLGHAPKQIHLYKLSQMKKVVALYYGTGFLLVAQIKGLDISPESVPLDTLPTSIQDYLRKIPDGFMKDAKSTLELGYVCLREATVE
jgi:thiamine kinase-like enzyme